MGKYLNNNLLKNYIPKSKIFVIIILKDKCIFPRIYEKLKKISEAINKFVNLKFCIF